MHGACVTDAQTPRTERNVISLYGNEQLKSLTIGHGWVIDNLTIETTHNKYGPYGGAGGDVFSHVGIERGCFLAGFKGTVMLSRGKTCLTDFGVCTASLQGKQD